MNQPANIHSLVASYADVINRKLAPETEKVLRTVSGVSRASGNAPVLKLYVTPNR